MAELVKDASLREQMGRAGRQRIERLFAPQTLGSGVCRAFARCGSQGMTSAKHISYDVFHLQDTLWNVASDVRDIFSTKRAFAFRTGSLAAGLG